MAIWAIVPAAGVSRRMNSSVPKQYLPLLGEPVLSLSLQRLLELQEIKKIMVAVSAQEFSSADSEWQHLSQQLSRKFQNNSRVESCVGGDNRCQSVLNALAAIAPDAQDDDQVLVHDAVRPCVRVADIRKLIEQAMQSVAGAVLAVPVRDTLKQVETTDTAHTRVSKTLDRNLIWAAYTPQMFSFALLQKALLAAKTENREVTDESSAIEALGLQPMLVHGHADNIKITYPEDLLLAKTIISAQRSEQSEANREYV